MFKKILIVILLILLLTFSFIAWHKNKVKTSQDELVVEFIGTFYQIDKEEMIREKLDAYANVLENKYLKYFANEEFERLVRNRVFYLNQECLNENGISCKLVDLKYNRNNLEYKYNVSIEFTDKEGKKTIRNAEGYIRLNNSSVIEYSVLGLIEIE